jgi:hypothetical protein
MLEGIFAISTMEINDGGQLGPAKVMLARGFTVGLCASDINAPEALRCL